MNTKLVTSLKLSRELKELGVKQHSEFYYDPRNGELRHGFESFADEDGKMKWFVSAFLSGELGEMLPNWFGIEKGDRWFVNPTNLPTEIKIKNFHYQADKNLAEALGKMLQDSIAAQNVNRYDTSLDLDFSPEVDMILPIEHIDPKESRENFALGMGDLFADDDDDLWD